MLLSLARSPNIYRKYRMNTYFVSYTQANLACAVIFAIMLAHDVMGVDRQEKQIKFDHALAAFIAYFISDIFWCAVITGILPKTVYTVALTNIVNFILMVLITYRWLNYVLAVLQTPNRNRTANKIAYALPLVISCVIFIIVYFAAPNLLVDRTLNTTVFYDAFQVALPDIYILAVLFYAFREAKKTRDPAERRKCLALGLFPVFIIIAGLVQIAVLPDSAVFCLSSAILMVIFYIEDMDGRISLDPLTKLNNRGQLRRYVSQESNLYREGLSTYVVMLDINDFKKINDTYGHAEGDRALVIMADALRDAVRSTQLSAFIGRYGGDEFTLIVHTADSSDLDRLAEKIRSCLEDRCRKAGIPYLLSVGIGWDRFLGKEDTIQKCVDRADRRLYIDKKEMKEAQSGRAL